VRQRWGNWDTQLCVHGIIMAGKTEYPDDINPHQVRNPLRHGERAVDRRKPET
jgi:hypothetical protein